MKTTKKMTVKMLAYRIKQGIRRFHGELAHHGYVSALWAKAPSFCAIGGALAYASKSKDELEKHIDEINRSGGCGTSASKIAAKISAKLLNHKLSAKDMLMLEAGYEGWVEGGERGYITETSYGNPFYKLGQRLRLSP